MTAEAARRELGAAQWAWREMLRDGLPTIKQGRRVFILTDDLIEFFYRKRKSPISAEALAATTGDLMG